MAMSNDQVARFLGLHSLGTMKAGQRIRGNLEKYMQRGNTDTNYLAVLGAELTHRDKEDDDTFVAVAIKYNVPGLEGPEYKPADATKANGPAAERVTTIDPAAKYTVGDIEVNGSDIIALMSSKK